MNKEIPILFSTPMVQAILEGRKTMTRRIVKPQAAPFDIHNWKELFVDYFLKLKPGDLLWVRETWTWEGDTSWQDISPIGDFWYKADDKGDGFSPVKWRPSIFMPKEAARIWLEVTGVRVERLQDISRGDAMEEGCPYPNIANEASPCMWFKDLWLTINGAESWDANPLVWVVSFKVLSTKGKL